MRSQNPGNIEDVPDISAQWFRDIVEVANDAPSWLRVFAEVFTEAALIVLFGLLVLAAWRARRHTDRSMALAVLGPAGMAAAYAVNEFVKGVLEVERPCRILAEVATIAACPPPGDWSFPSNHSAIAGAAVVGIVFAWRVLAVPALLLGLAGASSRVFLGAHFPHDAAVGFLLGVAVAVLVIPSLLRPATTMVGRLREHPTLGRLVAAER